MGSAGIGETQTLFESRASTHQKAYYLRTVPTDYELAQPINLSVRFRSLNRKIEQLNADGRPKTI